ncbi:hypothetical protein KPH14_003038 [Odynerus spinipes]|uniref:TGF-beta family profile domain-containing protein n=1 Tax=Odynerus spinipes TaxID=1348599 RepID=A0AAD9RWN7_9HYME|nr:hypothetical protein KPH14_003038 [Odynerus spinipes]
MGKLSIIIRSGTRENDREEQAEQQHHQHQQHQHHHQQQEQHRQQQQQQQQQQRRSRRGSIDGNTTLDGTHLPWCAGGGGSSAANSSVLGARAATARRRPLEAATPRSDSNSVAEKSRKGEVFVGVENSTATSSSSFTFLKRSTRILSGSLLLALLAMSVLCEPALGVPAPSSSSSSSSSSSTSGTSYGLQQHQPNASSRFLEFDESYEEEVDEPTATTASSGHSSRNVLGDEEIEIIRRSIVESLGLQRIPDPSKANVSQSEYERAHREYLKKVQLSQQHQEPRKRRKLHVFHATEHPGNRTRRDIVEDDNEIVHRLFFPVEIPDEDEDSTVDHASLRFLLAGHHRSIGSELEIVVYLREEPEEGEATSSRSPIARRTIRLDDPRDSRWLEIDVTELAIAWLLDERENLGLELEFLQKGLPTRRVLDLPALNVFTTASDVSIGRRRKRGAPEQLLSLHKGRRTECRGDNKKCCRHEMTVIFKDLKGFEFIVQPKTFDAGYCKGRCPPRYNPAHHHALLQSLIWKEDRRKAPRPCCAPSKLAELEILYFDENDSTSLKVSNWKNMRVLECACS